MVNLNGNYFALSQLRFFLVKFFNRTMRQGESGVKQTLFNFTIIEIVLRDFPGGAVVKNPPANAGDMGSSPGPGRSHMRRSS